MTADVVVLPTDAGRQTDARADETALADRVESALRENASALLGYLLRRTERDDAPDILSEVFVTAWRRRDALPEDAQRARMWLFGVARRTLANHRRSRRRASALSERLRLALTDSLPTTHDVGSPGSDSAERAREVREAVVGLPPRQRELVMLVHWDGFALTEAAEILGIRASTARSHYARARDRLARDLDAT